MIEAGRPCLDLAQQFSAVEKAVAQAKRTLIYDHLDHCLHATAGLAPREERDLVDEARQIAKFL